MPLGIDKRTEYSISPPLLLTPGDLLLLYTDGIVEAKSPEGRVFGVDRMLDLVRVHRHDPPEDILGYLFDALAHFSQRLAPQDDMTAVLLRVESSDRAPPGPFRAE